MDNYNFITDGKDKIFIGDIANPMLFCDGKYININNSSWNKIVAKPGFKLDGIEYDFLIVKQENRKEVMIYIVNSLMYNKYDDELPKGCKTISVEDIRQLLCYKINEPNIYLFGNYVGCNYLIYKELIMENGDSFTLESLATGPIFPGKSYLVKSDTFNGLKIDTLLEINTYNSRVNFSLVHKLGNNIINELSWQQFYEIFPDESESPQVKSARNI
jgi:hypothetical protein